ncbi:MAG: peptide deformylase, partial [Dehalococcoidales bacterium]|nr:peptide deformylase [Dehalococcoidales bacterium]
MSVLPIRTVPDPILRQKAKRVRTIDKSVRKLIKDMEETLQTSGGVGLAANQVGVALRVLVISIPDNEHSALINPEVVK